MGGSSSGGSYSPRVGGGGSDSCDFSFETEIFGPVEEYVSQLSIGDVLSVELTPERAIGIFDTQSRQVGSIAGSNYIPRLVSCLQQDNHYVAEVIAINGSQIKIRVSRN